MYLYNIQYIPVCIMHLLLCTVSHALAFNALSLIFLKFKSFNSFFLKLFNSGERSNALAFNAFAFLFLNLNLTSSMLRFLIQVSEAMHSPSMHSPSSTSLQDPAYSTASGFKICIYLSFQIY